MVGRRQVGVKLLRMRYFGPDPTNDDSTTRLLPAVGPHARIFCLAKTQILVDSAGGGGDTAGLASAALYTGRGRGTLRPSVRGQSGGFSLDSLPPLSAAAAMSVVITSRRGQPTPSQWAPRDAGRLRPRSGGRDAARRAVLIEAVTRSDGESTVGGVVWQLTARG
jgi:hypothetical protein